MKTIIATFILIFINFGIIIAQPKDAFIVKSKTLNVRTGPGLDYSIIGILSLGDVILTNKKENEWFEIEFENKIGFIYSKMLEIEPFSGWDKINYESGDTPDCENYIPKYDYNTNNYLRVNVGSNTDVVVKLMKIEKIKDICIRIVYIRSNDVYEIKNIPQGEYYLKIAYGKDIRKKIIEDICHVKFVINPKYEKGLDILNFNLIREPNTTIGNDVYENWSVPSFELSLDIIKSKKETDFGTFESNDISEKEFNK